MSLLRRCGLMLAAVILTLPLFATAAGAQTVIPLNANPQDHCSWAVCIGAESLNGSGNDILAAQVETRGQVVVPEFTTFYLYEGPNPTAAKQLSPRICISETTTLYGCNFVIARLLPVGWVLCGRMSYHATFNPGYPCIRIG
jgi:hypothetical protein